MSQRIAIQLVTLACMASAQAADQLKLQEPTTPPKQDRRIEFGPHGGELLEADRIKCEVVFGRKGIRVYLFDSDDVPISTRRMRGQIVLRFKTDPRRYRHSLFHESTRDRSGNCLYSPVDLSRVASGTMTTTISIHRQSKRFAAPIRLTAEFQDPLTETQLAAYRQRTNLAGAKLSKSTSAPDQKRVGIASRPLIDTTVK